MTRWARKRELRGVSRPAFPNRVLSPKAANLTSLMTLSLFSLPFYFIPSTSLPCTFEITTVHSYPHPPPPTTSGSTPFNIFHRCRAPSELMPSPLPAHPPSLSLSTLSPSLPFVAIAMSTHLILLLSHVQPCHIPFTTPVAANPCPAVPSHCC